MIFVYKLTQIPHVLSIIFSIKMPFTPSVAFDYIALEKGFRTKLHPRTKLIPDN
jgi:hypothetical protein